MRVVAVVVVGSLGVACGGANKPPAQPVPVEATTPAPAAKAAAATNEEIAQQYCTQVQELAKTCEPLAKVTGNPGTCPSQALQEIHDTNGVAIPIMRCVIDNNDCKSVLQCIVATTPDTPKQFRACDDHRNRELTVVGYPKAEWAQRNGASATKFSDARSTKALPVEMCGVPAANEWLRSLRCNDGSQPIKSNDDAERARPGNVGPGGRCAAVIDDYRVTCPERSYEIFIDAYACPLER
jgi:hypothetical protein